MRMLWFVGVPSVLLIAVLLVGAILIYKHRKDRIKDYSCAEAQLVSKKAQKQFHKEMRKQSDKLLYVVLNIIDQSARHRKNDVYVDTTPLDEKFLDDTANTKKYRNSLKESLRARGFRIIPDEHHRESVIHISWMSSPTDD